MKKPLNGILRGNYFYFRVCPEGFEPPSAEPESAILSIELWALAIEANIVIPLSETSIKH